MRDRRKPRPVPETTIESTPSQGESIDDGKGRIFPCDQCGADLEFSIGSQSLQCPYCGSIKKIVIAQDAPIVERDYMEMLGRIERLHEQGHRDDIPPTDEHAIRCESCGGEVVFQGTLTSQNCPYCASPLQRDKIHTTQSRISVDGVIPFLIEQEKASHLLRDWVRSLWWAPNDFLREGARGRFNGVYLPFFTYDAMTYTHYSGLRGDYYYVTVGTGNNRRTERHVRWSQEYGEFSRFFDDVLIIASKDQSISMARGLNPWPLQKLIPFTQEVLAGYFARTYDVPLEDGFHAARDLIEGALSMEVRQRIGGDVQNVQSQKSNYSAVTFKHLLLPVWLLAYRYRDRPYRVMINAATGRISGERPYSWIKIGIAIIFGIVMALILWSLNNPRLNNTSSSSEIELLNRLQFMK